MIERVVKAGNKNTIKAITNICNRCRGEKLKRNYHNILYCEECFSYQIINEYMYLERRHRKKKSSNHSLNLNFKLSKSQLKGEKFILDCYKNKKTGFLHAVCGAGKTEMCLKTIYKALQNNQSICFVIPRVEIIKQLCKRFNIYFPKTKIIGLYQNQFFDETADIFVSTPQQLIRFYKEFDLLIIDEVDAFPFANNPFLKRLIKKAKKINTTTIYISATINNEFKELIKNKKIAYFLIANRFHNHDLIMPRLSKYKTVFSKITVDAIKKYLCNKQKLIVFFPSISLMKKYSLFLKKYKVESIYLSSETKDKKIVINQVLNTDYLVLLSTTLLERGVTFSKINVFVFETDHKIFTKEVLIQIAGRVGRDSLYPYGDIIFFSKFKTKAMLATLAQIKKLNKEKNNAL